MTPHSHWMCNYTPFCTPIRLANDHIVYSAGVGSVSLNLEPTFTPVSDLGGEDEPDTNPTQDNHASLPDSPQIVPAPLEPDPNIPATPPANPAQIEPANNSPLLDSPEQSPTIPIAICRTRREIRPP